MTRQQEFRENFDANKQNIKRRHGYGQYSYAEGMNRKVARKIARDVARKQMRERRANA